MMQITPMKTVMEINIGCAAHAVAKALDCVGIDDINHGSRVGLICERIATVLGWSEEQRNYIMMAGMIHDCGVSSTAVHGHLVEEMEWEGAQRHCILGEQYLQGFEPFQKFSVPIRYHHTRWVDLPDNLSEVQRDCANLIFFADRLDVAFAVFCLHNPTYKVLQHKDDLLNTLAPYVDSLFARKFFDAAQRIVCKDNFWLELQDDFLEGAVRDVLDRNDQKAALPIADVEALSEFLSHIIDAKSVYTNNHSLRVADLSQALAKLVGYSDEDSKLLRLAGLLHDVGKLRTPDAILEKEGPLQPDEISQIHSHPLDSRRVLKGIFPESSICKWVSEHHEKLNGSGYPYGYMTNQIEQPTRILAIADIFQALCQTRPYRECLDLSRVVEIMNGMRDKGEIDAEIYQYMVDHQDDFYAMATA